MKNKIRKIIVTLVVAVSMVTCLAMTAFANTPQPRWSHWAMLSGGIEVPYDNLAECTVFADCSPAEADNIKVTCELQQYKSSWKTIKSWTESDTDGTTLLMEKSYGIAKNYSYQLKVTAKAYKGTKLLETVTEYFSYGYYQ